MHEIICEDDRPIKYVCPNTDGLLQFNAIYYPRNKTATIMEIEVDEDNCRYRGIGRSAVSQFEVWAREMGATKIECDIVNDSRGFWAALGYRLSSAGSEMSGAKKYLD